MMMQRGKVNNCLWIGIVLWLTTAAASSTVAPENDDGLRLNVDLDHRPFLHGVGSGDPQEDGILLWTRVSLLNETTKVIADFPCTSDPAGVPV